MADQDQRPGYLWWGAVQGGRQGEHGAIPQGPCLQQSIVCLKTFVMECQAKGETGSAPPAVQPRKWSLRESK